MIIQTLSEIAEQLIEKEDISIEISNKAEEQVSKWKHAEMEETYNESEYYHWFELAEL